jgi:hypothetical protein
MSQSAQINLSVSVNQGVDGVLNAINNRINLPAVVQLLNGTGTGQADKAYSARRTIAGSGTDALDFSGVLNDAFGQPITMASVKAIVILAAAANDGTLEVGGGATPFASIFGDATDAVVVKPGGLFVIADAGDGYAVTEGTGDVLTIANTGAAQATYDVVIIATSE